MKGKHITPKDAKNRSLSQWDNESYIHIVLCYIIIFFKKHTRNWNLWFHVPNLLSSNINQAPICIHTLFHVINTCYIPRVLKLKKHSNPQKQKWTSKLLWTKHQWYTAGTGHSRGRYSQVAERASASEKLRAEVSEVIVRQIKVIQTFKTTHACCSIQREQLIVTQIPKRKKR